MNRRRKNRSRPLLWTMLIIFLAAGIGGYFLLQAPAPEQSGDRVGRGSGLVPEGSFAGRKNIYDRNFQQLAVTFTLASLYARPLEMEEPEQAAHQLAPLLGLEEKKLVNVLRSARTFVWLGRQLEPTRVEQIAALGIKGLYFFEEEKRYYPEGQTAAQVIGYLSNEQGLAGVEYFYDAILRSAAGRETGLPTAGTSLPGIGEDGGHLLLSLDLRLQKELESGLRAVLERTGATGAWGVVMDPEGGEILAMTSLPAFDPNRFWDSTEQARRNQAIQPLLPVRGIAPFFAPLASFESGKAAAVGEVEEETKLISPDRQKKSPGLLERNGESDWIQVARDHYVSPEAWWPGAVPAADLQSLLIGRFGAAGAPVDLPPNETRIPAAPETETAFSGLQVLAYWAALVNGGREVAPHLLQAIWDPRLEEAVPVQPGATAAAPHAAAARFVREHLQGKARESKSTNLFMESLVGMAKPAAENPAASHPAPELRYRDFLLAVGPVVAPRLLMLVAVEEAGIDPAGSSPLRRQFRKIFPRLLQAAGSKLPPPPDFPEVDRSEVPRQWKSLYGQEDEPLEHSRALGTMPRLTGLGLRRALQMLQSSGIKITVHGSGRVVGQQPEPGSKLQGIEEIVLELRLEPLQDGSEAR